MKARHLLPSLLALSAVAAPAALAAAPLSKPSAAGGASSPQEARPRPRWMPEKSLDASLATPGDPRSLVLKIVDDAGATAAGGRLVGASGVDVGRVARVLEESGADVQPLVELDAALLRELRRMGEERSGRELADMSQYFRVRLAEDASPVQVLARLLALDEVENAYVAPDEVVPTGDVAPPTPDFTAMQGYRGPAPIGIDAEYALDVAGASGFGVAVLDVDLWFNADHEDLSSISPADVIGPGGPMTLPYYPLDHGTAVLGILFADPDAYGITGIAPTAKPYMGRAAIDGESAVPTVLMSAAAALLPGDVVLVEIAIPGPNWGLGSDDRHGQVPAEYFDAEFNAISHLTSLGIHVVEPAGNGSQDLDAVNTPFGHPTYPERFSLAERDSGAVLVAAGTSGAVKQRIANSNFGSRIDAFAWGEDVVTTGVSHPSSPCALFPLVPADLDQYYTSCFGGTSAASAIVAGAAAVLTARHAERHDAHYSPRILRSLFRTVGTPSIDPRMSLQPDLAGQISRIDTWPGLAQVVTDVEFLGIGHVSPGADLNGDGEVDWFVGFGEGLAPGLPPPAPGTAMAIDGLTGLALYEWQGLAPGDLFGSVVLQAGDLDGDGLADVAVSAPGGKGRISVFSAASGVLLLAVDGEIEGEQLGAALCPVGDVDGDGVLDLAVGAPGHDGAAGENAGRVLVLSGKSGQTLSEMEGTEGQGGFGTALALVGDVDGKGLADLAVGAPYAADLEQGGPGYVSIRSLESGQELTRFDGPSWSSLFGASLAAIGDGGQEPVLAVGAPGDQDGKGVVQIWSTSGQLLAKVTAQEPAAGDELGASLATTPDRDGDGTAELLIGAPGAHHSAQGGGMVLVVSPASGQILATIGGVFDGNRFGTHVAGGDLDGDGIGDVLAASLLNEDGPGGPGAAYVFLSGEPQPVDPPEAPKIAGLSPATVPAVAADGPIEVTIQGDHFETVTGVLVDGVDVPTSDIELVGGGIRIGVPFSESLGQVPVEVRTLGGSDTAQLTVTPNATPTLHLAPALDPLGLIGFDGGSPGTGVVLTLGSEPGDIAFVLGSTLSTPSILPGYVALDIGGGFQQLPTLLSGVVPAKGWIQVETPLPDLGTSYEVHFQAAVIPSPPSLPALTSNVQSTTVD